MDELDRIMDERRQKVAKITNMLRENNIKILKIRCYVSSYKTEILKISDYILTKTDKVYSLYICSLWTDRIESFDEYYGKITGSGSFIASYISGRVYNDFIKFLAD